MRLAITTQTRTPRASGPLFLGCFHAQLDDSPVYPAAEVLARARAIGRAPRYLPAVRIASC